jgi:hypothetical protein
MVQQARQTQLADAHNQAQALMLSLTHDPNTGAFAKQGKDAFGLTQQYLPQFQQGAAQIAQGIADPKARLAFQHSVAPQLQNQLTEQLDTHELSQHKAYADQTDQSTLAIAGRAAAANYNNPNIIASNHDSIGYTVDQMGARNGWSPETIEAAKQEQLGKFHSNLIDAMLADKKTNLAKTYLGVINPDEITPAIRENLQQKIDVGMAHDVSDGILSQYRIAGQDAGSKAFGALDSRADLSDDVKDTVRSAVQRGLGLWQEEQRERYSDSVENLEQRIASGKADLSDRSTIWSLYRNGVFSPQQTGNAIGRLEKAQQTQVNDQADLTAFDGAYRNGQALNPMDKDTKDGIGAVFQSYTKNVTPGSTEWINRGADIAAKTGITPQPMIDWARTQLVSGQPAAAVSAAETLMRLSEANPRGTPYALKGDPETVAAAKLVSDAVSAGTDPVAAVEHARQIMSMSDGQKQALEERYKAQGLAANSDSVLKNELKHQPQYNGGIFTGIPSEIPPTMSGEFEQLRQQYFKLTNGNAVQAADLAMNDLKNSWGITQANGKREFMQYAPEAMHPGLTSEALRADMEAAAKGHTDDPTKVRLVPVPDTAFTSGQIWGLGVTDKFGAYDVIRDAKNRFIPYQIPNGADAVAAQRQKIADEGMARLKAAQAADRAKEQNEQGEIQLQGRQVGIW